MSESIDLKRVKPLPRCRTGEAFKEALPLALFERLCPYLVSDEGQINVCFSFRRAEGGMSDGIILSLELEADLTLECRRCLSPFHYHWHSATELLLETESQGREEMVEDEPYERVLMAHDGSVNLLDVINDEFLLGLPTGHQGQCPNDLIGMYSD